MREIIERILDGYYAEEDRSVSLSCSSLELTLKAGENERGQFTISSEGKDMVEGTISTSDARMELSVEHFQGKEIVVDYLFHGEYMAEGEEAKGSIFILTDKGELNVPFQVTIVPETIESSIGPIKNLFHFANLAKTNWAEALKIFYSPAFSQVFHANDKKYYNDYRSLSAYPGHEQNMEEFLIHINKKQRVEYQTMPSVLEQEFLFAKNMGEMVEREITIIKNGWGYTTLSVEARGEFLVLPKTFLTEDDFIGNAARLTVFIDPSACGQGKNQGQLHIYNSYVSMEVAVEVTVGEKTVTSQTRMEQKKGLVEMFKLYQNFRLRKSNLATWLKETTKIVDRMVTLDEQDMRFRMYKAQLLITEGRTNEAGWILKHVASVLENEEETEEVRDMKVYYLYLTTLVDKDPGYLEDVTGRVKQAFRQNPYDWKIAWLLLFLSEELQGNSTEKWFFIEEQFERGCTSFAMYIEALYMLNQNPALLRKLDEFEIQVIAYGAKQGALTKDLVEQVLYLASKNVKYHPVLYRILTIFVRERKDPKILQMICTMLISAGLYGQKYLHWYEAAIQEKCRITNLYEYYLMSVPLQGKTILPKVVLLYFSYQNNLGPDHSAYLYRYIVENKKELSDIYETYYVKIQQFVISQLHKRRMNPDLAYLYEQFITEDLIDEQMLPALAEVIFANDIQVQDSRIQRMFVYQPEVLQPKEYPVMSGRGVANLYGEDCTIVFEDAYSNRYLQSVNYNRTELMLVGRFLPYLKEYDGSIAFDVLLYREEGQGPITDKVAAARAERILVSSYVKENIRIQAGMRLLDYYYDADMLPQVDRLFARLTSFTLEAADRAILLKYFVLRGKYQEAYDLLAQYGVNFGDVSTLLRLLGGLASNLTQGRDMVLLDACSYVLEKGKYNGAVLAYLGRFYVGPIKKMRDIYRATKDFGADAFEIAERIIVQILYTGAYLGERNDIFKYYVSQGANEQVERAYLAQSAYAYFVKERIEADILFDEIQNFYKRGEELPTICKIAFLKYCSELSESERKPYLECIEPWLLEMLNNRIRLNFFRNLPVNRAIEELSDKTIIEYRTAVGTKAKIHYVVVEDTKEDGDYRSEYMREIFPGVYTKEFVLFFGETLQYYIMEEQEEDSTLTESATIQKNDIDMGSGRSRYDLINDMLISRTLQDYDTLDQAIEDYMIKDFFNENLFVRK